MLKQIFAVHGDYTLEISCRNLHVELPIVYLQGRTFREFVGGETLATLAWISVVCTLYIVLSVFYRIFAYSFPFVTKKDHCR